MNIELFNQIVENRLSKVEQTLVKKAEEYATNADRLHNFKEAALLMRCTQAEACLGFMTKHIISVVDLVKSGKIPSDDVIQEKIGDVIAYCILLEAIWEEEAIKSTEPKAWCAK